MSEQPVWGRLSDAKVALAFADAQTRELDNLTFQLGDPSYTSRRKDDVRRIYLGWLVFARQVGVSIDRAGRAAGHPVEFAAWWDAASDEPTHAFFRSERNSALKEMTAAIALTEITDELAYWAFPHGPHPGDPLVPRCQQYNDWLYWYLWVPACELLFPWTLAERRTDPVALV